MNPGITTGRRIHLVTLLLGAFFFLLTTNEAVFARTCTMFSPGAGAFEADTVVIVRQATGDFFQTEEVISGDSNVGDIIQLRAFTLRRCQYIDPPLLEVWRTESEREDRITPDTRLLLFLKKQEDGWSITGVGQNFFWVQSPDKVDELRTMAKTALTLRKSWEAAQALTNPQERMASLWPFFLNDDYAFSSRAKDELKKMAPLSGDFIASRFDSLSKQQLLSNIQDIGSFGGERLRQTVIAYLISLQNQYGNFYSEPPPQSLSSEKSPEGIFAQRGAFIELCFGVQGLASFNSASSLPYFRQLGIWAAKHRLEDVSGNILSVLRNYDEEDIPTIEFIFKEFGGLANEVMASAVYYSVDTLRAPEAMPLLIQFLASDRHKEMARIRLTNIVGHDLGPDKQAWLQWYAKHANHLATQ